MSSLIIHKIGGYIFKIDFFKNERKEKWEN